MNKRDLVLEVLNSAKPQTVIPAAFFLHFDPMYHRGQPAVEKHLEYFRYTGMDFVKIQYENKFPTLDFIQKPEDWAKIPCYGAEFYEGMLHVVQELVRAAKSEALVVLTLYSPFMSAVHTTSEQIVARHIQEDPAAFNKGMQIITESLMGFVKDCIRTGLDGFYMSTQGGEAGYLPSQDLFDQCVRPYDLALMDHINASCEFNILHVCDYRLPYTDISPFRNYPGQIVNSSLELAGGKKITPAEVSKMYNRPFMGGMERLGILANGSIDEVRAAASEACALLPDHAILGADCTVPAATSWDNLKVAIEVAHTFRR